MKKLIQLFLAILFLCIASCQMVIAPNDAAPQTTLPVGMQQLIAPNGFNYETTQTVQVSLITRPFLVFSLYTPAGELLLKAQTGATGDFHTKLSIAFTCQKLQFAFHAMGIPQLHWATVRDGQVSLDLISRLDGGRKAQGQRQTKSITPIIGKYYALGTWDSQGLPDYLIAPDNVPASLLADIDASLPETQPVPSYHPEYLVEQNMDVVLSDSADIWITFVHEGAGYKNTLGYYTYTVGNEPASADDIDSLFVIFPNLSFTGSGGNLSTGNKVHLGRFSPNTGIGWFLIPNGWDSGNQSIIPKTETKYSNQNFNSYAGTDYRQHTILLNDASREQLVLGFEDITRPSGDNDFNDAIFYVTANPYAAVVIDNLNEVTQAIDTDGDGALDHTESYPNDPSKAFDAYSPSQNTFGTLAFEDLWPAKGDYDFNDLVVDYQFKRVLSTSYKVQEWEATIRIKAIGGLYHNGFGIELPCNASQVVSVTGSRLTKQYLNMAANGTEAGQEKAVIMVFDDAFDQMSPAPDSRLVNAESNKTYVAPVIITVRVDLTDDVLSNTVFANSPYNPFIIVNGRRDYEVHLPGKSPTDLANESTFGTEDDMSILGTGSTYKTSQNHPWALHLPSTWNYPREQADISLTHLKFNDWASSGGTQFTDWMQPKGGYRHEPFIYQP